MRLAIISDIHSNLEALTAALKLIEERSVDKIFCLGDIVGYGASPNECIDIVRQRCDVILMGNHDAAAVDPTVAEDFTTYARLAAVWTHDVLVPENRTFLRSLPLTNEFRDLLLVHASPVEPGEWNYVLNEFDAIQAFRYFDKKICFIGHSHLPGIFSESGRATAVTDSSRFIVNVGSVGQPRDRDPRLSFGIFDVDQWTYENARSDYDIDKAREKILKAGLPHVLGNRLTKGV